MNVKRFVGRNSREAMQKVRQAFGDNAVVLSTKPCSEGIEVLAMPPETLEAIERFGADSPAARPAAAPAAQLTASELTAARLDAAATPDPSARGQRAPQRRETSLQARVAEQEARRSLATPAEGVQDDVGTLAMSTLSFQDYVRERMLKKREAELRAQAMKPVPVSPAVLEQRLTQREAAALPSYPDLVAAATARGLHPQATSDADLQRERKTTAQPVSHALPLATPAAAPARAAQPLRQERASSTRVEMPSVDLHDEPPMSAPMPLATSAPAAAGGRSAAPAKARAARAEPLAPAAVESRQQADMMNEIRAMKGLIEERFGALAFMERLQKSPKQAQLTTRLIDCGFSPALIRKLVDGLTDEVADEMAWAGEVLQRNLVTGEADAALEDQGGVFALVGSTGVGKTTSTAKLAAAFATRHGAANLGLITLDAYRLGAHEQLRGYGRILGVPVHTAHDRVALEDLLDLLSAKKMVLIDTAGLAQRDTRTRELLEMLSHPSIQRLLVVNAAQQGETIEDVLVAYKAAQAKGIVLSKLDEAVKLGPALDALIRHRLKVVAVANGQRVPEDWHRLTAQALMHRALRNAGSQAWRLDVNDVNLLFATPASTAAPARRSRSAGPRGAAS
jgi:flagellar biosynthesis protein FlhF